MSLVVDEHRAYLADRVRLDAFRTALSHTVKPGDVVLDLASGTGILGLMACQSGAARVYACEESALAGLAREIAAANGFADRIVVLREHSSRLVLPERVNVLVTDQIGHFGFEAGLFEILVDARRRFLTDDLRVIPAEIELWLAPVEQDEIRQAVSFWDTPREGLHWTPAAVVARNTGYPVQLDRDTLLGPPRLFGRFVMPPAALTPLGAELELEISRAGELDGLGGWFAARLAAGVWMTNSPIADARIDRRNVVLPIAQRCHVEPGSRLRVRVKIVPDQLLVTWAVDLLDGGGTPQTLARASTFAGMLFSAEDLRRTAPDARLRLTSPGQARRTVLELVDGQRSVAEIERQVYARHQDLLLTRADAAALVAEVLTRYAR